MGTYKSLTFLLKFIKKSKKYLLLGIIGMLISSLIGAPIPYLMGYIIDNVVGSNKSYNKLFQIIAIIVVIGLVKYMLSIFYQYYLTKVQQNVVNEIRISMMDKVIDAPLSFINKNEKGYILSRISEVNNIGSLFSPSLLGVFSGVLDFFSSIFIMINLSLKLTIISLAIIPIYFFIARHSSKMISNTTTNVYETSAILNGEFYEVLNGIEDIKLLNGKDIQLSKLKVKIQSTIKSIMKQNLNFILFVQNIILTNSLVTAIVLLFSAILILNNQLTVGIYTSFSIYMSKILSNTQSLGSLEITLKPICISIERIKEFLNLDSENPKNSNFLNASIESLTFKNVNFRYDENNDFVIKDLTEVLEKGDKVLINGVNGAGKTTLIKLLTGLYSPTSGEILINNSDSSKVNKKSIREKIGIVSQNIFLFKGTILENILYGCTDKTKDDVLSLIKELNLVSYIDRFDNGLNTKILQNGSGLSGGQSQIVALLRAIIKKRDIIILDEATSNLDIGTRKCILNILKEKKLCNILIIISHQNDELNFISKTINL